MPEGSGPAIGPAGVPGRPGLWAGADAKSRLSGDLGAGSQGTGTSCALGSLPLDTHPVTLHLLLALAGSRCELDRWNLRAPMASQNPEFPFWAQHGAGDLVPPFLLGGRVLPVGPAGVSPPPRAPRGRPPARRAAVGSISPLFYSIRRQLGILGGLGLVIKVMYN